MPRGITTIAPKSGYDLQPFLLLTPPRPSTRQPIPLPGHTQAHSKHPRLARSHYNGTIIRIDPGPCRTALSSSFLNISDYLRGRYGNFCREGAPLCFKRHMQTGADPILIKERIGSAQTGTPEGFTSRKRPTQLFEGRQAPLRAPVLHGDRMKLRRELIETFSRGEDPDNVRQKYNIVDNAAWKWTRLFACINSPFDSWPAENPRYYTPVLDPTCERVVEDLWKDNPDRAKLVERWQQHLASRFPDEQTLEFDSQSLTSVLPGDQRVSAKWHSQSLHHFVDVLAWLLHHDIDLALQLLDAQTAAGRYTPAHIVTDSLWYIARVQRAKQRQDRPYSPGFIPAFWRIWDQKKGLKYRFHSSLVFLIDLLSTSDQVTHLYERVDKEQIPLFPNMQLRIAVEHARLKNFERSLDAFHRALSVGMNVETRITQRIMTRILNFTVSTEVENGYEVLKEFWKYFESFGVPPNRVHHNILMLKAIDADDLETALEMYRRLTRNDAPFLETDAYSHAIILKACKKMLGGPDTHGEKLAEKCARQALRLQSEWIAAEYLHYVYLYHKEAGNPDIYDVLLHTYARFWPLTVLRRLGIVGHTAAAASLLPREGIEHSLPAVHIMLTAYLKDLVDLKPHNWNELLLERYADYRTAIESGDSVLAPLAEQDYGCNSFLKAFCSDPQTLRLAPHVMNDMLKRLPETAIHYKLERPIEQAQPTAQSWNILMHGFLQHDQPEAAERILEIMRERGIEPDEITWDTLTHNYARTQDVRRVSRTLLAAERSGIAIGDSLQTALRVIRDVPALRKALEFDRVKTRKDDIFDDFNDGQPEPPADELPPEDHVSAKEKSIKREAVYARSFVDAESTEDSRDVKFMDDRDEDFFDDFDDGLPEPTANNCKAR